MQKSLIRALAFVAVLAGGQAQAGPYDSLVVFGDSLSDNGNLYTFTGGANPPSPDYWNGRFSNGMVAVEHMATRMGAVPLIDYAVGGAKTGMNEGTDFNGGSGYTGLGLTAQVSMATSPAGSLSANSLYVLWAGPNDFFDMTGDPNVVAATAIGNMATAMQQLYADGARHFFVPLMPDLGLTPSARTGGTSAMVFASLLTDGYNTNLRNTLSFIDQALMPLGEITFFDTAAFLRGVVANPLAYGLDNVRDACLGNINCTNADGYLFWDDVHPTATAHRALGDAFYAATAPVPEPETYAMMLMGLGLLGLVARRRKQQAA
jgi:outer membrane lipase/esterase